MDPARALAPLETVVIETAFGRCGGTFARPEGEAWKSGVVVVGDADDDHLMTVCKDLASVGHAAIVLQLDLAPLTVGFGAGGLVSLAAGYRCQIGASVSFYAEGPMRLRANLPQIFDRPKPQAAPLLCLVGALEEVLPADLAAIRAHLGHFGMRETMVVYPRRKTGFCHPASEAYRETEAGDAWGRLLRALDTAPRQRHRFFSKSAAT